MAEGTIGVMGDQAAHARVRGSGPASVRGAASLRRTVLVRCTAPDALSNLVAVLELTADGQMRCSAATRRPLTATVRLVEDVLVAGDYYDGAGLDAVLMTTVLMTTVLTATRASPSRRSRGRCSCRPAAWRGWPGPGSS